MLDRGTAPTSSDHRDDERQQQLLAVAQQLRELQPRLRQHHPGARGSGRAAGAKVQVRSRRARRPVSSRKTSSSVRRPTRQPLGEDAVGRAPGGHRRQQRRVDVAATRYAPARSSTAAHAGRAARRGATQVQARRRPWKPERALGAARVSSARRARGDHAAPVDDHAPGRRAARPRPLVRGQHDGHPVGAQLGEQVPDVAARLRVQPGGRLVDEHQLGPADERHRRARAAAAAAGEPAERRAPQARRGRAARQGLATSSGWAYSEATWRSICRHARRGQRRRRSAASRRCGGAAPRVGAAGRDRGPAPARLRVGGTPRRSRGWWSCRRRWGRGRR